MVPVARVVKIIQLASANYCIFSPATASLVTTNLFFDLEMVSTSGLGYYLQQLVTVDSTWHGWCAEHIWADRPDWRRHKYYLG